MNSLFLLPDCMGSPTNIPQQSNAIHVVQLAANTPRTVTVPPGARLVLFSSTGPFWARIGAATSLPTGDDLSGGAPELNPAGRAVTPGQPLGLVAAAAAMISLCYYA